MIDEPAKVKSLRLKLSKSLDRAAIRIKGGGFAYSGGHWGYFMSQEHACSWDSWIDAEELLRLMDDTEMWSSSYLDRSSSNFEEFVECAKKVFGKRE